MTHAPRRKKILTQFHYFSPYYCIQAHHVYKIQEVTGVPFYGYHSGQHRFLKLFFYDPFTIKRAVSLLQNGGVMEKHFQPHESHIPYVLQFMMDYSLQGMNFLHLRNAKFRRNCDSTIENQGTPHHCVTFHKITLISEVRITCFDHLNNFMEYVAEEI